MRFNREDAWSDLDFASEDGGLPEPLALRQFP